jgi:hypothetical protein
MHIRMLKQYVLTIIFLLVIDAASAQYMPMTQTFKTPYGNFKQTTWVNTGYRPMYYGGAPVLLIYDTKLTIVLKNDSTFTDKVTVNAEDSVNTLTKKGRKKGEKDVVYKPSDTKKVERLVDGKTWTGIPVDTCWLFKSKSGPINIYSRIPAAGEGYFSAIQKGEDGPILPITEANLMPMVNDDPKCQKLVSKKKLVRAILIYNFNRRN